MRTSLELVVSKDTAAGVTAIREFLKYGDA